MFLNILCLCVHYVKYYTFFCISMNFLFNLIHFSLAETFICSPLSKFGTVHINMLLSIAFESNCPCLHNSLSIQSEHTLRVSDREAKKVAYCIYTFLHRRTRHLKCYRQTLREDLH